MCRCRRNSIWGFSNRINNSCHGYCRAVPDVFYSLAGTSNGEEVTVSLCGSSFDTFLAVYDSCGGAILFFKDDSCGLQSELTFTSDGSTTYIVRVEGFDNSESGDYAFAITCVLPGCDSVPSAIWTRSIN